MTLGNRRERKAPPPAAAAPTFLTKLGTLRDFVTSMGVRATEGELSDALKASGHSVELALERVLSGSFGGGGSGSFASAAPSAPTPRSAPSTKRRGSAPSSLKTPKSSSSYASGSSSAKRPRFNQHQHGSSSGQKANSSNDSGSNANQNRQSPSERLLLCKRWTVATSKSTRGRVGYGERLDFSENWSRGGGGSKKLDLVTPKKRAGGAPPPLVDPIVRFRSASGNVEGTLNRYLCSILSPLLRVPAGNAGEGSGEFAPIVSVEGEALMEDRALVMGSEVPISLKVHVNDPAGFFELFRGGSASSEEGGGTSSKLFFQKKNAGGGGGKMPSYQGKKARSSFTDGELAEAAFHLLQWAQNGEEMPFARDSSPSSHAEEGSENCSSDNKGDDENDDSGDGDYEEGEDALESQEVDELNQLVASKDSSGKGAVSKLHELSDPVGFKSGVVLRPYQRQALYWMCRREGCNVQCEANDDSDATTKGQEGGSQEDIGELELLAELATATYSTNAGAGGDAATWQGGEPVACDCGPVVVRDESTASGALPVIEYGRSTGGGGPRKKYVHHPLWQRRFLASEDLGSVYAFYVNELLGVASATPPLPPKTCVGGILADAMGLGKTVMLLSLILKTKENEEDEAPQPPLPKAEEEVGVVANRPERHRGKRKASVIDVVDLSSDVESEDCRSDDDESWDEEEKQRATAVPKRSKSIIKATKSRGTTLVIAPLSLVSQWEEELASKTDLSHLVYYDTNKKATGSDAFSCLDVVVTTYGTVQSEYVALSRTGSMEPGDRHPLLKYGWKRIILDEAHMLKNPGTVVSRACCMLQAETRWCVTGTPIQNSLQDVYGLLKFLRHEPWCEATFWRNAITNSMMSSAVTSGAGNASATLPAVGNGTDSVTEAPSPESLAATAAFGRVRRVLAPIILRRTKDTLTEDGKPILTLPPIDSSVISVALTAPERDFYNALLERSQTVFEGFLRNGTASKSWFAIFSLLQRLRQACDHVSLTVKAEVNELPQLKCSTESPADDLPLDDGDGGGVDGSFLSNLLSKFKNDSNEACTGSAFAKQVAESLSQCVQSNDEFLESECPICLEEPRIEDSVHTPCAHMFCKSCLLANFQEQLIRSNKKEGASKKLEGGSCPVCDDWVKISSLVELERANGRVVSKYLSLPAELEKENSPNTSSETGQRDTMARETLDAALNGASSSKLQSILFELDEVWSKDPGSKVLIFSQYLGFLDIIGRALRQIGVQCFRIDGKMSLKERVTMIDRFNKFKASSRGSAEGACERGAVFLVSMKAGGCGLNLVSASSVFIVDPWWNQAVEDQCINRIHRIGQQAKIVRVRKFIVTDSVEERIASLQGKKKGMATEILSTDGVGQLDSTKPTLDDFKLLFR